MHSLVYTCARVDPLKMLRDDKCAHNHADPFKALGDNKRARIYAYILKTLREYNLFAEVYGAVKFFG